MCFYSYEAEFFDEIKDKVIKEQGMVWGKDFSEATKFIQDYYGEILLAIDRLEPWDCGWWQPILAPLKPDTLKKIEEDIFG